ncbi:DUF3857 domain-containing transglutaminase family protein [bacterium]|nr:DUF3857 domain-containing transglutaminase family protein [bacterium]
MKTVKLIFAMMLFSYVWVSCNSFDSIVSLQQKYKIEKMPYADEYPNDDGVVILESYDVQMDFDNNYKLSTYENVHVVKKLFKNIEDYASIEIPVYFGEKLLDISARTTKADGSSIILAKKDFFTIVGEGDGSTFYSDKKSIRFTFPAVEKGCIIEYQYRKRKDFPFVMDVWYIQNSMPTMINTYTLKVPKILIDRYNWNWFYKAYNYPVNDPVIERQTLGKQTTIDQTQTFNWTLRNIPAFSKESNMPPTSNYHAYVKFAPDAWKSWNDIASWYYNKIFLPKYIVTDPIKNCAKELTADKSNETEMITSIFNSVKSLRYVAIELGIGGIQPSQPEEVLTRKFGDCKDKSILLLSLLRAAGITAKPVLVLTASSGIMDPGFPNWNFNHMIVKIETKDKISLWLDPTAQFYNVGEMPWEIEGINVLVINEDGTGSVERTPASSSGQNVTEYDIKVDVSAPDKTKFDVEIKYNGESNCNRRYYFHEKTHQEIAQFCKSLVVHDYVNAQIDTVILKNVGSPSESLILNFQFSAPNAIQQQGDLYFMNTDPFKLFTDMGWLAKDLRRYPIFFKYPYTVKKKITLTFDRKQFNVRNLPKEIKQVEESLYYSSRFSYDQDNTITANEMFSINENQIYPDRYKEARKFFENIKNKMNEKMVFVGPQ